MTNFDYLKKGPKFSTFSDAASGYNFGTVAFERYEYIGKRIK